MPSRAAGAAEAGTTLDALGRRHRWITTRQGTDRLVLTLLESVIRRGFLELQMPDGRRVECGRRGDSPAVRWTIHRPGLFKRLVAGGRLALGESYMDGWWDASGDRIVDLLGVLLQNDLADPTPIRFDLRLRLALAHVLNSPFTPRRAARCVQFHYDLGNEFFSKFEDASMTASCGYQLHPEDTLDQMQQQKYDRISKKLGLEAGGTLLDVGCGWGGMLIHAAKRFPGVEGLGITLSKRQVEYAREWIAREGLSDRVRVELRDYRELEGVFDFIVSIGMFEHVGKASYRTFMDRMRRLLAPGGVGLLHTMGVTGEDRFSIDPWIEKYIFPGAAVPHLEDVTSSARRAGLLIGHVENLKPHYAETFRWWGRNFEDNRESIRALGAGFDERFIRRWRYYLQMCEAGFRYGHMQLYQCLFARANRWAFPMRFDF